MTSFVACFSLPESQVTRKPAFAFTSSPFSYAFAYKIENLGNQKEWGLGDSHTSGSESAMVFRWAARGLKS